MPHAPEPTGVAIFAKAPIEGFAKTRLIPELGAAGAATLQARMIERTVATAVDFAPDTVSLWCTPNRDHPLFQSLAREHDVDLRDQIGADLGARMLHALRQLTPTRPMLLVGTDCPALTREHLAQCADALRAGADAVFIPAEDGGYVLVGMARPLPDLFAGISWGSDRVMAETRARAAQAGLRLAEPTALWDLDTMDDYRRARVLGLV